MNPPREKKQRQRDSLRLSEKGQSLVRQALRSQRWSQDTWATNAYISISTIRRFLKGENIDRYSFDALFTVLHLDPNDLIAPPNDKLDSVTPPVPEEVSPPLVTVPPERSPTQHSGTYLQSFMITGTFSPNKLAEIEVALALLEKLLRNDCTITLVSDKNYLAVSGKFSEDKKPHVEVALMHLEKLLLEHCIIADWME